MNKNYFSDNLKHFIEIGLDREDLAYVADISCGSIKNYQTKLTQNPNMMTICKIAKALDISVEDLVNKDFGKEVMNFEYMSKKKQIEPISINLSKNIDRFITANNYNINKAGRMLKTNETTIRKIRLSENGSVSLAVCLKIAECMNVTLDNLLFGEVQF